MIMFRLLDFLYLDGYRSLIDKYRDQWRNVYSDQRHWSYSHYREYFNRAWQMRDFKLLMALRRAKRRWDYIALYNLMVDMDGDEDLEITAPEFQKR